MMHGLRVAAEGTISLDHLPSFFETTIETSVIQCQKTQGHRYPIKKEIGALLGAPDGTKPPHYANIGRSSVSCHPSSADLLIRIHLSLSLPLVSWGRPNISFHIVVQIRPSCLEVYVENINPKR